jgi:hypothetical protein
MIEIKRAVKYKCRPKEVPLPYHVEMENGKQYTYNRESGVWEDRDWGWFDRITLDNWEPCSPLEVIVVCGIKGLE